jgi:hypothetical protein
MKTKRANLIIALFIFLAAFPAAQGIQAAANELEVRATVEQIFQQLRTKNYEALYDTLPAASRAHVSRERFASALRRTQDMYVLERIEIGKVNVAGNFAVVDTVLYGKVMNTEGKIVVQQYLVREDGKWKVATGDRATIRNFLGANPGFARKFQIREPRVFVKNDGGWIEFKPPQRPPRQG